VKTKVTKSEVRELVLRVRQNLGRATGKKLASRDATARALGCSPGTIYNYEHGAVAPNARLLETLRRVAAGNHNDPAAADAERLASMLRAISTCGGIDPARVVFERAVASLS
jgi:transcriptional regulator with XRE-family HTH domain